MKVNFNLKRPKSSKATLVRIILRWSSRKLCYSTREFINPKHWQDDPDKRNFQRAKETRLFPEYPEFNLRLDHIEASTKTVFRRFLNNNHREPEVKELKELLDIELRQAPRKDRPTFFSFAEKFIEQSRTKVNGSTGKVFSPGTIMIYRRTLRIIKEFGEHSGRSVDFDTINVDFYNEFIEYLMQVRCLATNTIGSIVKTLKCFLNAATEQGVNTNLAFKSKSFRKLQEETSSIYLTIAELEELYSLDLSENKRLEKVRDLFLVGCWTGLRFSDFTSIAHQNISEDFIEIETIKTKERVVIPIHPTVKQIIEKYRDIYHNSLPPKISNVKMNKYLKELGQMVPSLHALIQCRITRGGKKVVTNRPKYELLVTHTARRSFATNLYLEGLSPITIMKITGHRTQRCFMTYLKVSIQENAVLLRKHWEKKKKAVGETTYSEAIA